MNKLEYKKTTLLRYHISKELDKYRVKKHKEKSRDISLYTTVGCAIMSIAAAITIENHNPVWTIIFITLLSGIVFACLIVLLFIAKRLTHFFLNKYFLFRIRKSKESIEDIEVLLNNKINYDIIYSIETAFLLVQEQSNDEYNENIIVNDVCYYLNRTVQKLGEIFMNDYDSNVNLYCNYIRKKKSKFLPNIESYRICMVINLIDKVFTSLSLRININNIWNKDDIKNSINMSENIYTLLKESIERKRPDVGKL